nr:hypothetical protein [Tanacetum cinerariifolium]
DENTTNPQQVPPTPQSPHTLSTNKLPILKKERLHKGYDRFQSLLSQLETHGAGISTEMPMRSFICLYLLPGLKVFKYDVKGSTGSSSSTQNVTFVSSDNTSSTHEVNTAYGVSTFSGHNSQKEGSSSYTDDLMYSFFANQSSGPQLDHEDLKQIDEFDLEEMDLKWQDTLLESADQKGIKTVEGEMQETLDTWSSDVEDSHVNDRFVKIKGMHAVLPHMTGNYMPLKYDFGINVSKFTYGPKQSTTSESDAKTSDLDSYDSSSSEETLKTVPKPVKSQPKVVNEPKVWSDAPIIKEYESNSDDEYLSKP